MNLGRIVWPHPAPSLCAVFSPWPGELNEGVRFAVLLKLDDGTWAWRQPLEVDHVTQTRSDEPTHVAVVVLDGAAVQAPLVQDLTGGLVYPPRGRVGIRAGLIEVVPELKDLAAEVDAARALRATAGAQPGGELELAMKRGTKPVAPDFIRTTGGVRVMAFSLCRIFRWD